MIKTLELPLATDQAAGIDWPALKEAFYSERFDPNYNRWRSSSNHNVALSATAWAKLKTAIAQTPLPVTLENTGHGFTVGIRIWTEAEEPFPSAFVRSEPLFVLQPDFLPGCPQASFDWAWEELSPLAKREQNLELLKRCRLTLPGDKNSYAY